MRWPPSDPGSRAPNASALIVLMALALALTIPASPSAQGVSVALVPAQQGVEPGAELDIELQATQAGSPFNGFDAIVRYDPAALTFLPANPISLQEGSYMLGACGSTFHVFSAAGDSLSITDVLLCKDMALPGPGQLYRLRFRASDAPQRTVVRIDSVQFYNGGLYVNPAYTSPAVVAIGVPLEAGRNPLPPPALRVKGSPNPCAASVSLRLEADAAGDQSLEVLDVRGRVVRLLENGSFAAGARTVRWDGTDGRGARLAPGLYLVCLRSGSRSAQTRIALLE